MVLGPHSRCVPQEIESLAKSTAVAMGAINPKVQSARFSCRRHANQSFFSFIYLFWNNCKSLKIQLLKVLLLPSLSPAGFHADEDAVKEHENSLFISIFSLVGAASN